MKLGPVTKSEKRNNTTSKKIDDDACGKIVTSSPFFQFTANLEQSGSLKLINLHKTYIFISSNLLSYKN